jgi:hypothetical protein
VIDLWRMRHVSVMPRLAGHGSPAVVCWDRSIRQPKKLAWSFHRGSSLIPALPDWSWAVEPDGSPADSDCPAITSRDSLW